MLESTLIAIGELHYNFNTRPVSVADSDIEKQRKFCSPPKPGTHKIQRFDQKAFVEKVNLS
jgi:hypothetical protein